MGESPIADVVMHPVRLQIIKQLGGRQLTTSQLREALPGVTTATLYRHVAKLVDAGILTVVGERRVRGAVERTLALGDRMARVDQAELRAMSDAQLRTAFLTFIADVSDTFDRAVANGDESARDFLGFGEGPLYVTQEDLASIQAALGELLAPYRAERAGCRRVTLATILLPEDL
ncbi:helix-turn-helix domain-containing protein [Mumia zhuanghuii]|uniref:Helix-turn-helix domain-containing protein n=2 Tax=Mumia TaxID=1546255 RepID=A0ABW1QKS5_9ACTN|nr:MULTISPECIES: helix-turn-helix domain-containing protein [Mumia]KAA1418164.1 helix-turn-helix domain-containing protein [Mumia zhuanghuii]